MSIINAVGGDRKVRVSLTDQKSDVLENKLVAGPGVTITKVSVGGIEHLEVSADDVDAVGLHYVKCREENGCVIYMEVRPVMDNTVCFIKKVAC